MTPAARISLMNVLNVLKEINSDTALFSTVMELKVATLTTIACLELLIDKHQKIDETTADECLFNACTLIDSLNGIRELNKEIYKDNPIQEMKRMNWSTFISAETNIH